MVMSHTKTFLPTIKEFWNIENSVITIVSQLCVKIRFIDKVSRVECETWIDKPVGLISIFPVTVKELRLWLKK